nr:MAG TPA: hypothetical protein [Caudoviricetes sp.]
MVVKTLRTSPDIRSFLYILLYIGAIQLTRFI